MLFSESVFSFKPVSDQDPTVEKSFDLDSGACRSRKIKQTNAFRSFAVQNLKNEIPLTINGFFRLMRQTDKKRKTIVNVRKKNISHPVRISIMILSKSASSIFSPQKLSGVVLHYEFNYVQKIIPTKHHFVFEGNPLNSQSR